LVAKADALLSRIIIPGTHPLGFNELMVLLLGIALFLCNISCVVLSDQEYAHVMAPYDIVPDSDSRMSTPSCSSCCGGWVLGTPDVRVRPLASYSYRHAYFFLSTNPWVVSSRWELLKEYHLSSNSFSSNYTHVEVADGVEIARYNMHQVY
jgi:hypothetical protein